jgi:predicted DCC family thiol-disulfide oxidoreductase YuxK
VFDGVCVLCNRTVDFIILRDRRKLFRFAQIQSDAVAAIVNALDGGTAPTASVYLIEGNNTYTKSTAVLRILRLLGGVWRVLYIFALIPRFMRDGIYDFIARHRYGWFGRTTSCRALTSEIATALFSRPSEYSSGFATTLQFSPSALCLCQLPDFGVVAYADAERVFVGRNRNVVIYPGTFNQPYLRDVVIRFNIRVPTAVRSQAIQPLNFRTGENAGRDLYSNSINRLFLDRKYIGNHFCEPFTSGGERILQAAERRVFNIGD